MVCLQRVWSAGSIYVLGLVCGVMAMGLYAMVLVLGTKHGIPGDTGIYEAGISTSTVPDGIIAMEGGVLIPIVACAEVLLITSMSQV